MSHPSYHTLYVCGKDITPPSWLPHGRTLLPGLHKISHTPYINTPGDTCFKRQHVIPGVYYLVSCTAVCRSRCTTLHLRHPRRFLVSTRMHTAGDDWRRQGGERGNASSRIRTLVKQQRFAKRRGYGGGIDSARQRDRSPKARGES